jgi:hypothetical protein
MAGYARDERPQLFRNAAARANPPYDSARPSTLSVSAPSHGAGFVPAGSRNAGSIGSGTAAMVRPVSPATVWANSPRATKWESPSASSSEATIVAQQSAAASSGRQWSAVLPAMMAATAALVAAGSIRSLARSGASPIAVTKASQNYCSSAAQATSFPSLVG